MAPLSFAPSEIRIGSRGSQLALWQANDVAARIASAGGPPCRIVTIKTSGDRLPDAPLSELGGKRLFVKEIEEALLDGEIDLAVHSSKDLPVGLPEGLTLAAMLPREDPLDAVVLRRDLTLDPDAALGDASLLPGASAVSRTVDQLDRLSAVLGDRPVLGTGSVRRVAQLTRLFPRAYFKQIRGNLDTRLRKLDRGDYDALILAAAGLRRLGLASRITLRIPAPSCLPAPGQGIVAVEVRGQDAEVRALVERLNDPAAAAALTAERAVVEALGGGCQMPIGALASGAYPEEIELAAVVISLDGRRAIYGMAQGMSHEAAAIGARVGAQLLADGAGEILADAGRAAGAGERTRP